MSELSDQFSLSDFVVPRQTVDPSTAPWMIQEREFPQAGSLVDQIRFVIGYAILAPSIRNTQPWRFELQVDRDGRAATIDLHLDQDRVLKVADPEGRAATIACGSALACLRLSMSYFGLGPRVEHDPEPGSPTLLARVRSIPTPKGATAPMLSAESQWMFQTIPKRRTLRGEMDSRPVSPKLQSRLATIARDSGASLHCFPFGDVRRDELIALIERAGHSQDRDSTHQDELQRWTREENDIARNDGVSAHVGGRTFTWRPRAKGENRDAEARPARGREIADGSPLLAVLSTATDSRHDWLKAGEALVRLLLRGRVDHLFASYFGAPVEHAPTRQALSTLLGPRDKPRRPQVVLRLGHGGDSAPSPRRPVDDVLAGVDGHGA